MKTVLIISPYFPPSNGADTQRIRMSLAYFKEFGWNAEVVAVHPKHSEMVKDDLLLESVPKDVPLHLVEALSKKWTSKLGLGSLGLRSLTFYNRFVGKILKEKKIDLIYFSTTQFSVCILGAYWKSKFKVPYVIDMQDPWHTDYYKNKPKADRPPKYWFSYRLNKYLEPIAMKSVDGLISVSERYLEELKKRYPRIDSVPKSVITFGAFAKDFEIAYSKSEQLNSPLTKKKGIFDLVYVGVVGKIMSKSLTLLFQGVEKGLETNPALFSSFRFHFIGTSYAPSGKGIESVIPIAKEFNVAHLVTERTSRISFYETLKTLQLADGLIVPGTDDAGYTPSKIYPYILAQKPLLGIFHEQSSAIKIIKECNAGLSITLNCDIDNAVEVLQTFLRNIKMNSMPKAQINWSAFEKYTAKEMTRKQVELFNEVLKQK